MNGTEGTRAESALSGPDFPDIGHEIGEHNIRVFSLDIHNPVFIVSAVLVVMLVIGTLLFPQQAATFFADVRVWTTVTFDWFYFAASNLFVLFCFGVALSPLGRIRLGGQDAVPQYGYSAWLAMLFAAGVGIGLMFFGVLEPVTHTLAPPLGIDPADTETARAVGMSAAILHWGLHAWAIYAVAGLSLAFFCFNRGMPLTLRSGFFPLIGKSVWGPFGHVVDIVAVLATLFGLAVSLGFGAEQIAGGLQYLFAIPATTGTRAILIMIIIGVALASVIAGLDKGVKRLSWINMTLAGLLWLFVLIAGPTLVILGTIAKAGVDYVYYLPALSNWIGREDVAFVRDWSTFYWAWWVAWAPFVGMFIARISFGRTVREFITWVLIVPTVIGIVWMATLGGTALDQYFAGGYTGVAEAVPELALFKMLEQLPMTGLVSAVSVFLITIFFVTSADSGSLVMDTITAGGKMDAPVQQRAFWCLLAGMAAMALMLGGGMASLQALTLTVGLPFTVVLLCLCAGLIMGLREELAVQH
ncbi:MAG: BCCT family transporter [Rhodospirillaceae bacterium]|nr:BCCT family transporter [Rhodospirillaceae bacterium]MDE0360996.1 BCCT family transporter [Rhodospirillaceae bacterium]